MKYEFKKSVVLLLLMVPCLALPQQLARKTNYGTTYLEHLPADYDTTKLYPCIIFLHGSGERGTGSLTDLARLSGAGIPKQIQNGHKMCFTNPVTKAVECFIVLSPQTNKWSWRGDGVIFARWALKNYRINPNRMYLTGLSMGGEGTWYNACFSDNEPNLWAAIAPVCGRASYTDGANVALRKIAVWAFHGSADKAIPLPGGLNPINGMFSKGATPVLHVYADLPHGIWDRVYNTGHTYHNPNLYEWFLTKKKQ